MLISNVLNSQIKTGGNYNNKVPFCSMYLKTDILEKTNQHKQMLAFDLDGTFLVGSKKDFDEFNRLYNPDKQKLVFVTGKLIEELQPMLDKYSANGIDFPIPDYFIANDGQQIYSITRENNRIKANIDNEWETKLSTFDVSKVLPSIEKSFQKDLIGPKPSIIPISYKSSSRLKWFLFNHSMKDTIGEDIKKVLAQNNLQAEVILDYVLPEDMKKKKNLEQYSHLLDSNGGCYAFAIAASNKGEAIKFLQQKFNIKDSNVIAAGNAQNDISLSDKGFWFIVVANALEDLKESTLKLGEKLKKTIIMASKDGLAGINEALKGLLKS
ncbi:MAG: HAD-IIB family hydrolase [Cyanobacteriota bacterium]